MSWFRPSVRSLRRGPVPAPRSYRSGLVLVTAVGLVLRIVVVASGGRTLVSPWWLIASYVFQSAGELCLSPVGLSSMTKLSPRKYVGQMMGIWFLAASVGNLIAGLVGGNVDPEKLEQMPALFTWTTVALMVAAVGIWLLVVPIRRMMRDVPANEQ